MPHFDVAALVGIPPSVDEPYPRHTVVAGGVRYICYKRTPSLIVVLTVWDRSTEIESFVDKQRRRKRRYGKAGDREQLVAKDGSS